MSGWGMPPPIVLCPFRCGVWALLRAPCLRVPLAGPGLSALSTKTEVQRSGHPRSAPGRGRERGKVTAARPPVCKSVRLSVVTKRRSQSVPAVRSLSPFPSVLWEGSRLTGVGRVPSGGSLGLLCPALYRPACLALGFAGLSLAPVRPLAFWRRNCGAAASSTRPHCSQQTLPGAGWIFFK